MVMKMENIRLVQTPNCNFLKHELLKLYLCCMSL
ncbi:hypothetical protein EC836_11355 [Erwinia sp. JUb26]|nr:hypothetical protein EC836_11355 [Erwinia sp. JUb26]